MWVKRSSELVRYARVDNNIKKSFTNWRRLGLKREKNSLKLVLFVHSGYFYIQSPHYLTHWPCFTNPTLYHYIFDWKLKKKKCKSPLSVAWIVTLDHDNELSLYVILWKSKQKEGYGWVPRRRHNATTMSCRPQRPAWKISFAHAIEVSKARRKKNKKPLLVVGLLSWSQGAN